MERSGTHRISGSGISLPVASPPLAPPVQRLLHSPPLHGAESQRVVATSLSKFTITALDNQNHLMTDTFKAGDVDETDVGEISGISWENLNTSPLTESHIKRNLPEFFVKMLVTTLLGLENTHDIFVFLSYKHLQEHIQKLKSLKNQKKHTKALLSKTSNTNTLSELISRSQELKAEIDQTKKLKEQADSDYEKDRRDFSRLIAAFRYQSLHKNVSLDIQTPGVIVKRKEGDIEITNLVLRLNNLDLVEPRQEDGDDLVEAVFKGNLSCDIRIPLYDDAHVMIHVDLNDGKLSLGSGVARLLRLYSLTPNTLALIARAIGFMTKGTELTPSRLSLHCHELTITFIEGDNETIARLIQTARSTPGSIIDNLFTDCPLPFTVQADNLQIMDKCSLGISGEAQNIMVTLTSLPAPMCELTFPRTLEVRAESGTVAFSTPVSTLDTTLNLVIPETIHLNPVSPRQTLPDKLSKCLQQIMKHGKGSFEKPAITLTRRLQKPGEPEKEKPTLTGDFEIQIDGKNISVGAKGGLTGTLATEVLSVTGLKEGTSLQCDIRADEIKADLTLEITSLPEPYPVVSGGISGRVQSLAVSLSQNDQGETVHGEISTVNAKILEHAPAGLVLVGRDKDRDIAIQVNAPSYFTLEKLTTSVSLLSKAFNLEVDCPTACLHLLGEVTAPDICHKTEEFSATCDANCVGLKFTTGDKHSSNQLSVTHLEAGINQLDSDLLELDNFRVIQDADGNGRITLTNAQLKGDQIVKILKRFSESRLAGHFFPGLNVDISFDIPVLNHGIQASDIHCIQANTFSVEGDAFSLGVYRTLAGCLLTSFQCLARSGVNKNNQLVVSIAGCPALRSTLPRGLVHKNILSAGHWLTHEKAVVPQSALPQPWISQHLTGSDPASLNTLLNHIALTLAPVTRDNRLACLTALPAQAFTESNDRDLLTRYRNLCAAESGILLTHAIELTLQHQLSIPPELTAKAETHAGTAIPCALAGRLLVAAGNPLDGIPLINHSLHRGEASEQILGEWMLKQAKAPHILPDMRRGWTHQLLANIAPYFRKNKPWARAIMSQLTEDALLACSDTLLLEASHKLSGASGLRDIDTALQKLNAAYKLRIAECTSDYHLCLFHGLEWPKQERESGPSAATCKKIRELALEQILDILRLRQRNVGCVFVHPPSLEEETENKAVQQSLDTNVPLPAHQIYKSAVCYLFGLEGFPHNPPNAKNLLSNPEISGYPQVMLLTRLLGDPVPELDDPDDDNDTYESALRLPLVTDAPEKPHIQKGDKCSIS